MKKILLAISLSFIPFFSAASAQNNFDTPFAVNPRVSTDQSVDCTSIDRILDCLIKEGMTDEEKVLAVFHWIRRMIYHGDGPQDLAFDFHNMIHVLGNGSCLRQTTPMAFLLGRLGYECESWVHDGHHMIQVKYGGGRHCFDPHMNFFVYDRSDPPQIASLEQLRADSTLAYDAVAEGRAAPGYLLCGDSPGFFSGRGEWYKEEGWPEMKIEEPFGQISLRRGESLTLTWMPGEHYWKNAWEFSYGTYHTCGPNDVKDAVNWPLFEPHMAEVNNIASYRHWAQGKLVYYPDLFSDNFLDGVVKQKNIVRLCPCFVLMPANPAQEGELIFSVNCPYVITAGELKLKKGELDGKIAAEISTDELKTWKPVEVTETRDSVTAKFVDQVNGSFNGYMLKLILDGNASMESVEIITYFQLNPYSLPYLVPGDNVVRVDAEHFGSPLKIEWGYAEGPQWNRPKISSQTFTEPGEFTIHVGGEKYPRNLSLTLGVLP